MARRTGSPTNTAARPRSAWWKSAAAAALWLLPAPCAAAQPGAPGPEAAFLPAWNRLPDRAGWQMLVSPAFPYRWPPPAQGAAAGAAVKRYAFAMRLNPALADGAEMAAPWASSTQDARGGVVVKQLSTRLQPLGVQGVRPLRAGEVALAGREQEVAERLLAGGDRAASAPVRDFTCGWIRRQGVVAAAILPQHPGFARWLNCS